MTFLRRTFAVITLAAGAALTSSSAAAANCQPGNGVFTGCFYSGTAFETFLLERQDPHVNFVWGLSGPYAGGPIFQFSARWQGYFNFNAGSYRFSVNANQGARLYIDGQLVLDRWTSTSAGSNDITQTLGAGTHLIQLDYYNGWTIAYVQLSWSANKGYREFYISPSGNDNSDGRTPTTAWATPFKVTLSSFQAGDRILFEGGRTFSGVIYLDAYDQGTDSDPITITSYGNGRATIQAGTLMGLLAYNTAGIEVSNLNFVGAPGTKDGIQFYTDLPGTKKLSHIRIDSVEVSGFGSAGISIFSSTGTTGYDDIRITNVLSHDNVMSGLWMGGYQLSSTFAGYAHSNLYIGNCKFYNNTGATDFITVSGFGIFLASTDGAVIEHNVVYENGQKTVSLAGAMGIITMEANNIIVQNNEVHHTRAWFSDGGGIAFDGGTTNSVMQYNYIHDNDGSGINLAQYYPIRVKTSNNTVRYNISQNDGRKSISWAGILIAGPVQDLHIYNNTIYATVNAIGIYGSLLITGQTTNLDIRNNVFMTQGGVGGMQQVSVAGGQVNIALQNNSYWGGGLRLNLNWNHKNATTLADFRQISSQETLNGVPVGVDTDPKLAAPGTGPSIDDTNLLSTLTAYTPLPGSPLMNQGFNLSAFGLNAGTRDFVGTPIPQAGAFEIGAIEATF